MWFRRNQISIPDCRAPSALGRGVKSHAHVATFYGHGNAVSYFMPCVERTVAAAGPRCSPYHSVRLHLRLRFASKAGFD